MSDELLPCPFCGSEPVRKIQGEILSISCPQCVTVGFHNLVRFGCLADAQWNDRFDQSKEPTNDHL